MEVGWRSRLKTVAVTAGVTSLVWMAGAIWWLAGHSPDETSSSRLQATTGVAPQPADTSRAMLLTHGAEMSPNLSGKLIVPVVGVRRESLTDTFTQSRSEGARRHDAIDIMAPRGTPVVAASSGRVEKLFLSEMGGLTVYVRSPNRRRVHYYAHLDRYASGLREGAAVRQGQLLGYVGSTGNASPDAPHLHYAIMVATPAETWSQPTVAVNPYPLLTGR